jgi:hypothetical protein
MRSSPECFEKSLDTLIQKFDTLIFSYSQVRDNNVEKALSYVVQQIISLFSFGLPSSNLKLTSILEQG